MHAYAATPRIAERMPGQLLALGPAEYLGAGRVRVIDAMRAAPYPELPAGRERTARLEREM
jgi:hypothetical protein